VTQDPELTPMSLCGCDVEGEGRELSIIIHVNVREPALLSRHCRLEVAILASPVQPTEV